MSDTIVLGYDGSSSATAALAETVRIAQATGSAVVVVFAYYISPLGGGDVHDYKEALEKVATHETARAVADLEAADVPCSRPPRVRQARGRAARGRRVDGSAHDRRRRPLPRGARRRRARLGRAAPRPALAGARARRPGVVRILVVGTGGVGAAAAAVAARRDFFESITLADLDPGRPRAVVAGLGDPRFSAAQVDASDQAALAALMRDCRRGPQRDRPALQPADLRRRPRGPLHVRRHGDDPRPGPGVLARRPPVRRARALARGRAARARRDGRRAGPLRRLRPLRRGRAVRRARRGRDPRRREPRRRGLRLRADLLDLDDDRGVPQPAARLGARPRLLHDRAVLRARAVRLPGGDRADRVRQRRARGGRARAARARLPPRHLQVRPRPGVHRRAARRCTSSGSTP